VWDIRPAVWSERACGLAGRNLTEAEWQRYMPGLDYHRTCPDIAIQPYAIGQLIHAVRAAKLEQDMPGVVAAYQQTLSWVLQSDSATLNGYICWRGGLEEVEGIASLALPACDRGVALADARVKRYHYDTRGVTRAMAGDLAGALDDFRAYVVEVKSSADYQKFQSYYDGEIAIHEVWILALEAGRNPFDETLREELRQNTLVTLILPW
jgi:hypothetical protein